MSSTDRWHRARRSPDIEGTSVFRTCPRSPAGHCPVGQTWQVRDAVTKVIGDALAHDTLVAGGRYLGQLWLRDAETTAWHVLLARRRLHETEDDRKRFFEAWGNA